MIRQLSFAKIWAKLRIIGLVFILFGFVLGVTTAQKVVTPPAWIWTTCRFIICFYVFCMYLRLLEVAIVHKNKHPHAKTYLVVLVVAGLAFVFALSPGTSSTIISFLCILLSFFVLFFAEESERLEKEEIINQDVPVSTVQRSRRKPTQKRAKVQSAVRTMYASSAPLPTTSMFTAQREEDVISRPCPSQKVFICYNNEDEKWAKKLRRHLHILKEKGLIDLWDETKILPGAIRQEEIEYAIDSAAVAVVLISANLLNSSYIKQYQLPKLLYSAAKSNTMIVPVHVSSCYYKGSGLEKFQRLCPPGKPWATKTLDAMTEPERNEMLVYLAEVILQRMALAVETSA